MRMQNNSWNPKGRNTWCKTGYNRINSACALYVCERQVQKGVELAQETIDSGKVCKTE